MQNALFNAMNDQIIFSKTIRMRIPKIWSVRF